MRIAIVHDFLIKLGGAEKVLQVMHKIFPDAPIYTLLYDKKGTHGEFENPGYDIRTSRLQKLPEFIRHRQRILLSKFPQAIEEFDLSGFNIVISSSNSFAHGVITRPNTLHITYCYSPMRYAWDWTHQYLQENNINFGLVGIYVRKLISNLRIWDFLASKRTDAWIAISQTVALRIKKYYKKDSIVIYPPVNIDQYLDNKFDPENYYLIVSRLTQYKKIDLAIEVFNHLSIPLFIIGEGTDRKRLEKMAGNNIQFLGWKSDKEKIHYFKKCRAFLFPGEDDFGITPVEAMAAGRPVIAYNSGGATETVIAGKTGEFFDDCNDPESLKNAVLKLEKNYSNYSPDVCQNRAKEFSQEIFARKFKNFVETKYKTFQDENK